MLGPLVTAPVPTWPPSGETNVPMLCGPVGSTAAGVVDPEGGARLVDGFGGRDSVPGGARVGVRLLDDEADARAAAAASAASASGSYGI